MIHDVCDYCRREFGRLPGEKAICLNCGLENARPVAPETAMRTSPPEMAIANPERVERAARRRRK